MEPADIKTPGPATFTADTYVSALARETYRAFACRAKDPEEIAVWQTAFRARLIESLGIPAIHERGACGLDPELLETCELEDHVREYWTLQSEPGFRIHFYVLRPLNQSEPLPLVLAPHGHGYGHLPYIGEWRSEEEKVDGLTGERDIGLQAVRAGYVAIVPVLRGFHQMSLGWGRELPGEKTCRSMQMRAFLFGRTLIGERVHDMMRLLDYAYSRPDIDASFPAITGNSGGGTVSLFTAAVDPRIAVAVPSCYFCTFEASIGAMHHCECNYIPGILRLGEMYDVAGLCAPRPFLAVAGLEDPIFPIEGVRLAFDELKKIYRAAGAAERVELYVGPGGHRYYKERVWSFISQAREQWLRSS